MEKKKAKDILSWVGIGVFTLLLLWSPSRIFVQQQLMKVGFFKPKLVEPLVNEVASASFVNSNHQVFDTANLKGKVVFINFWATWCPPCRAEMPSIQKLYDKFRENDQVQFLLVEVEGDEQGVAKFLQEQNLDLPMVYATSEIPSSWFSGVLPTTIILDKNGRMATKEEGLYDYSTKKVEEFVQNLINQ